VTEITNPTPETPKMNREAKVDKSFLTGLVNQSGQLDKLAKSLALVQGELEGAKKGSNNPFFGSDYADLASVLDACRSIMSKHGISIMQYTDGIEVVGKTVFLNVSTMIMHESGQWMKSSMPFPVEQPVNCHKLGSAVTYGRRYGLSAIIGLAQIDDDGNVAMSKEKDPRITRDFRTNKTQNTGGQR
tara:strand:+ start:4219 stop:4779 length:561 start_codon:yes stop_codon:yes gene_type:complete